MDKNLTASRLVSRALNLIEEFSIQRRKSSGHKFQWLRSPPKPINWKEFRAKAFCDFQSVDDPKIEDACGIIDRSLMRLGDRHSLLTYPGYIRCIDPAYCAQIDPRDDSQYTWKYHKENWQKNAPPRDNPLLASSNPAVQYKGDLLHLTIPGFFGDQTERSLFQNKIRNELLSASQKGVGGVVVDLSSNPGGSMCPMLWGLSPLLGPNPLGYFSSPSGEEPWHINYGIPEGNKLDTKNPSNFPLSNIPVAVLAGPGTSSSGEIALLSFRGRPNTQSFGQPTDGNSSGNSSHAISPDERMMIHLCSAVALDRRRQGSGNGNKNLDGGPIIPDNVTNNPLNDAIQWLQENAPPRHPSSKQRGQRSAPGF